MSRQVSLHQDYDRRTLLAASVAGALGLTAASARTALAEGEHEHHEHMDMAAGDHTGPAKYQALVDSALKCVGRGEVCVDHCLRMMSTGDTSLKDCMRTVQIMMPMCAALMRAAAYDAARLKDIAKVCLDICADCEKECKKHAEHHTACKACAESCSECMAECKKVI